MEKSTTEKELRILGKSITTKIRQKYWGDMIDENPNFIAHIDYIYVKIVKYNNLFSAL